MKRNCFFAVLVLGLVMGAGPRSANARPDQQFGCPNPDPPTVVVNDVQPRNVAQSFSTVITVYGTGFISNTAVDMGGVGVLPTEFVDETLLRATVPGSLAPGDYPIAVRRLDSGECSNVFQSIRVQPPPATAVVPVPTNPPTPGQPVMIMRNFSVNPTRVKPGEEFTVSVDLYNTGSRGAENTLVTFAGGAFVPVGNTGYLLGLVHINATVTVQQRMRAPDGLQSGVQDVKVSISSNDFEGKNYTFNASVPVEIDGPQPTQVPAPGRPQIVIEQTVMEPRDPRPGETFTITMTLANRGTRAAQGILVKVGSADVAVPADASNVTTVRGLSVGGTVEVWQPLTLGRKVEGGRRNIEVAIDYADPTGATYNSPQTVGVDVNAGTSERPQLLLQSFQIDPRPLFVGQPFTLTVVIANVGGSDAERVVLAMGGEAGASLKPFAPLGSGNVKFIERVARGKSVTLVQQLQVDGNADPASYNLENVLSYEDARANKYKESQFLSLQVRRKPQFQIGFTRPAGVGFVGQPLLISVDALNIGARTVNISNMELSSNELEIPQATQFIGPVNGGTLGTFETTVIPKQTGNATLRVRLNYLDEFSQPQVIEQALSLEIQDAPPMMPNAAPNQPAPEDGTSFLWRVVRGLLGLGS